MQILAIDPGPKESAWVLYDGGDGEIRWFGKRPNADMNSPLAWPSVDALAVEMIASYGMPVGAEVFETCVWIGRFVQQWRTNHGDRPADLLYRRDVKLHLCNSSKAKDANIRQALIDRFGGSCAIGTKKTPGPLYGIKADVWAALAVAVTYADGVRSARIEAVA